MPPEHFHFVRFLAGLGVALMLCVLVGWVVDFDMLVRPSPRLASTVPSTALCLALLYLCLPLFVSRSPRAERALAILATAAMAVAALNIALSLIGRSDLDHRVFAKLVAPSDRMSYGTGLGILFAGATLRLAGRQTYLMVAGLMAVVGLSTFVAIIAGNSFEPGSAFAIPLLNGMSIYTAGALALLFFALLLSIDARSSDPSTIEQD